MDDWQSKAILAMIPVLMASTGWVVSLESRIQVIDARQQERTNRFDHLEQMLNLLTKEVSSPAPKPETKVAMEALRRDMDNIEDVVGKLDNRLNNLHDYLLRVPMLHPPSEKPPPPFKDGRRGDVFELYPQRQP